MRFHLCVVAAAVSVLHVASGCGGNSAVDSAEAILDDGGATDALDRSDVIVLGPTMDTGAAPVADADADAGPTTFSVGGTVIGLLGEGLALQNDGADTVHPIADGPFTFATTSESGEPYAVTIQSQPHGPAQTCVVANGSGTVKSNVTDVTVTCTTNKFAVGVTVTGLDTGESISLTNNGGDDLVATNGSFTFGTTLDSNTTYDVEVKTSVAGKFCGVTNGSGKIGATAVSATIACIVPTTCKAIKAVAPTVADGVFHLTPTASEPFDAYCDMTSDGGGWTLALKAGGPSTTFRYDSPLWTNNATLNETSTDLSTNQAKFASFSQTAFDDIRLVTNTAGAVNWLKISRASASLQALFASGTYVDTGTPRKDWMILIPGSGLQLHCNIGGINAIVASQRVRLGFIANQENDCNSPDSVVGFGIGSGNAFGSKASYPPIVDYLGASLGDPTIVQSFGYIFVR